MVISAHASLDYESEQRTASFALVVLSEPRLKDFQYGRARLVRAEDDRGRVYRPDGDDADGFAGFWQHTPDGLATLDGEWLRPALHGVDPKARRLAELEVALDVRVPMASSTYTFAGVSATSSVRSLASGDLTLRLEGVSVEGREVSVTVAFEPGGACRDAAVRLMQRGAVAGRETRSETRVGESGPARRTATLELTEGADPDAPFDVEVAYPARLGEARLELRFTDVELP